MKISKISGEMFLLMLSPQKRFTRQLYEKSKSIAKILAFYGEIVNGK